MLVSDKYNHEGAYRGMLGYIIEAYRDGNYEVEFSDQENGISIAQVVVAPEDIIESPEL
jgi:hypothetical protein